MFNLIFSFSSLTEKYNVVLHLKSLITPGMLAPNLMLWFVFKPSITSQNFTVGRFLRVTVAFIKHVKNFFSKVSLFTSCISWTVKEWKVEMWSPMYGEYLQCRLCAIQIRHQGCVKMQLCSSCQHNHGRAHASFSWATL